MSHTTETSKVGLASTARPVEKSSIKVPDVQTSARPAFAGAAIGMSWQLAIVVLFPIIGGYKLDQALRTTPVWTLIGLVLAMVSSIFVIRRALAVFGNFNMASAAESQYVAPTKPIQTKEKSS
jgi:F0F1-type ATP synthase assembly protein I